MKIVMVGQGAFGQKHLDGLKNIEGVEGATSIDIASLMIEHIEKQVKLRRARKKTKGVQRHYAIAHGSANEVKAALAVARAWGWLDEAKAPAEILDRLLALLWRLTHPR